MTDEKGREDLSLADYQCLPPKSQDQDDIRNQVEQNEKDINRKKVPGFYTSQQLVI